MEMLADRPSDTPWAYPVMGRAADADRQAGAIYA